MAGNLNEAAVDWVAVTKEWKDILSKSDSFLKEEFRPRSWYCDEDVPREKVRGFLAKLEAAWQEEQPWTRDTERERVKCEVEDCRFKSWKGKSGHSRMESWNNPDIGNVVLFGFGRLGLVIGDHQSHPMIHCNDFIYVNSDGSHEAEIPDSNCAADVFSWAVREFGSYCNDFFH